MRQFDWYQSFFQGPFAHLQLDDERRELTERDVHRVIAALDPSPQQILDAPCGTGRHSLELCRRGHHVMGIDFNPLVLEAAKARAREAKLPAEFRRQDLRELDFASEFDAVLCLWGSFGYFSDEDNQCMLRNFARALKKGGALFVDTHVAESLFPSFRERDWSWWGEGDDRVRVCEERRWDDETGRVEATWTFFGNGQEQSRQVSIRIYTCRELVAALRQAGFANFELTEPAGKPFTIGSPRLWLQARMPA